MTYRDPGRTAATLRVRMETRTVSEIRAFDQDVIKIGKLASAHLRLDDDSVSRLHAVIEREGDVFQIIDLGSTSGTLVNDRKVTKAALSEGDVIRIGDCRLTVL